MAICAGVRWRPTRRCASEHWFWHPNDESSLKSLDELLTTYDETVGHGAQLMLGLAPDRRGLLPDSDVARLEEFGKAMRERYAHNLALSTRRASAEVSGRARRQPGHILVGSRRLASLHPRGQLRRAHHFQSRSHHGVAQRRPAHPEVFDRCLDWNEWKTVAAAQAIGHKKIDIFPRSRPAASGLTFYPVQMRR